MTTSHPRKPCTQTNFATDIIGENCPFCGHTNLVHSMPRSPTPGMECPLCVLEIKVEQLDELIEKYQGLMDQALERANSST